MNINTIKTIYTLKATVAADYGIVYDLLLSDMTLISVNGFNPDTATGEDWDAFFATVDETIEVVVEVKAASEAEAKMRLARILREAEELQAQEKALQYGAEADVESRIDAQ